MMDAIKTLRGCGASGVSLAAGTVYAVPGEVSAADAAILVRLGKAEPAEMSASAEPEFDEHGLPAAKRTPPMPAVKPPRKARAAA